MLPDPRDPSLRGGLLVLSRRGRAGVFGAHNEPQGQVWTPLHGRPWRARAPHERGRGTPPPSSFFFARAIFLSSTAPLLFFSLASVLRQGSRFALAWPPSPPCSNWKSWSRGDSPVTKGEDTWLRWGLQRSIRAASRDACRRCSVICNRIFPIVSGTSRRTWAFFSHGWKKRLTCNGGRRK